MAEIRAMETQEQITARLVEESSVAAAKAVSEAAVAAARVVAQENNAALKEIAVLQTDMNYIKNQQTSFEIVINKKFDKLDEKFSEITCKLDELKTGRPSWGVALMLGGLFSLCVGLITFVVTTL